MKLGYLHRWDYKHRNYEDQKSTWVLVLDLKAFDTDYLTQPSFTGLANIPSS